MKTINRISLNGCRYVASEKEGEVLAYALRNGISPKWIRYSPKRKKYYLRLWGRYKHKSKEIK